MTHEITIPCTLSVGDQIDVETEYEIDYFLSEEEGIFIDIFQVYWRGFLVTSEVPEKLFQAFRTYIAEHHYDEP